MGERESPWIRAIFGLVPILMGAVILGAQVGVVPTDGGRFTAPPWVILPLAVGLILFGLAMGLPRSTPAALRSGLFLVIVLMVAVVCNWTAFAPGIRYTSTLTIGAWSTAGEDPIGGRIVFGLVAIAIDAVLAYGVYAALRNRLRPK